MAGILEYLGLIPKKQKQPKRKLNRNRFEEAVTKKGCMVVRPDINEASVGASYIPSILTALQAILPKSNVNDERNATYRLGIIIGADMTNKTNYILTLRVTRRGNFLASDKQVWKPSELDNISSEAIFAKHQSIFIAIGNDT